MRTANPLRGVSEPTLTMCRGSLTRDPMARVPRRMPGFGDCHLLSRFPEKLVQLLRRALAWHDDGLRQGEGLALQAQKPSFLRGGKALFEPQRMVD